MLYENCSTIVYDGRTELDIRVSVDDSRLLHRADDPIRAVTRGADDLVVHVVGIERPSGQVDNLDFVLLEKLFEHHRILGDATRAGVKAIGLELLSKNPGNILTAVKVSAGIDGVQLVKTMQGKYMAYIAGGQDPYKGKIFRIAHLGYMGGFDIITALSALEMTLSELDYDFESGKSLKAAEDILKENWE